MTNGLENVHKNIRDEEGVISLPLPPTLCQVKLQEAKRTDAGDNDTWIHLENFNHGLQLFV